MPKVLRYAVRLGYVRLGLDRLGLVASLLWKNKHHSTPHCTFGTSLSVYILARRIKHPILISASTIFVSAPGIARIRDDLPYNACVFHIIFDMLFVKEPDLFTADFMRISFEFLFRLSNSHDHFHIGIKLFYLSSACRPIEFICFNYFRVYLNHI